MVGERDIGPGLRWANSKRHGHTALHRLGGQAVDLGNQGASESSNWDGGLSRARRKHQDHIWIWGVGEQLLCLPGITAPCQQYPRKSEGLSVTGLSKGKCVPRSASVSCPEWQSES